MYDINAGEVAFGPVADDWPVARHLGIFDMPGDLIGYGALVPMGRGMPGGNIVLGAGAIRFKRPAGPVLLAPR